MARNGRAIEDELFDKLAEAAPRITETVSLSCEERIEAYRLWRENGDGDRLRAAVRLLLEHFAATHGSTDLPADLEGIGALRASQGLPLEAIPTAWLIIAEQVWQSIVGFTFEKPGIDLSELWSRFMRYVNKCAGAIQSSYINAQSEAHAIEFMSARATLDILINATSGDLAVEEGLSRAGHPGDSMRLLLCVHRDAGIDLIADKSREFRWLITELAAMSGRRVLPWTVHSGVAVTVLPDSPALADVIEKILAQRMPGVHALLSRRSPTRCVIRSILVQSQPLLTLTSDEHPLVNVETVSLLDIITAKAPIEFDEVPSWVRRFFEGDEKHDRKWSQTVQALIAANFNVAECAQNLYVHQNTVYYRLESIKRYCGKDLREPGPLTDLQIAMRLGARFNRESAARQGT
jgi:hypothetical protein